MAEPIATPTDVRTRLNLPEDTPDGNGISNSEIEVYLEDAAADNERVNKIQHQDGTQRKQIEWRLAAIKILTQRKGLRAYHQQSLGSMSRSYEVKTVDELRSELEDWDPSGTLGKQTKPASVNVPSVR